MNKQDEQAIQIAIAIGKAMAEKTGNPRYIVTREQLIEARKQRWNEARKRSKE